MVGSGVAGKVVRMTYLTGSTTSGHGRCLAVGCLQCAIDLVTCITLVMDLVVGRINRCAACGTSDGGGEMAERTVGGRYHAACMIGIAVIGEVAAMTGGTRSTAVVAGRTAGGHINGSAIGCL